MTLQSLGWNAALQKAFERFEGQQLIPARVAREDRESYIVYSDVRAHRAAVSGAFRYRAVVRADYPAVGDWVAIRQRDADDAAVIHDLLPRRSIVARKAAGESSDPQPIAANVDRLLLCTGLDSDFNLRRIERYLTLAHGCGVAPLILLTKADVCDDLAARVAAVERIAGAALVLALSAVDRRGIDQLRESIGASETVALVGSSGVGKSSLINALFGYAAMQIGSAREHDGRGRHTTTHRQLLFIPGGGTIIDTPGMRELGLVADADDLAASFDEIERLAASCRFRDCRHESEPGCAVHAAVRCGDLTESRLESYRKQLAELRYQERRENPAAARAEKEKWKSIHKQAQHWMRRKYGG